MEMELHQRQIRLPEDVLWIIKRLEGLGYEAYAVGGCVRDTLLGRTPGDWDITTSAKPEQVKEAFSHTVDTGLQHGTVTVLRHHIGYEVTTYRIDGEYKDSRHPEAVAFTDQLVLDLERRDFTINAMAYNPSRGIVDAFDGMGDLQRGIIRCVGNPTDRFKEDALRMLRAVRFSGQLGFSIDQATKAAIHAQADSLRHISAERIRVELTKLLVSQDGGQIREAYATGMTAVCLPAFDAMMETTQPGVHHIYTVGEHSVVAVEWMNTFFGARVSHCDIASLPQEVVTTVQGLVNDCTPKAHQILCLTMLLHDVAKPVCRTIDEAGVAHFLHHPEEGERMAGQILRKLTFDRETIHMVKELVRYHDWRFTPTKTKVRKAAAKLGREAMPLLILVQFADALAQNPALCAPKLERILTLAGIYQDILGDPLSIKELDVTGRDIIALGVAPGPQVGEVLAHLLEMVLANPGHNEKKRLLDLAQRYMEKNLGL